MRTRLIHALTGTEFSVPSSRAEEYLKAGHRLAEDRPAPTAPEPTEQPKAAAKPKAKKPKATSKG